MKRLLALLLALMLGLSALGSASAAKMVQPFATDYFQIYIPGDWIIDTTQAVDYFGALDLGFAYSPDETMLIEAYLFYYSDWAYDSLWTESNDTWDEYVEFVMDDLKEEDPELIATIHAGKFPGVLIRGTNNSGAYLYGEIMINSYAYGFYFYLLNEDGSVNSNITQEEIDLFWSIVETFVPVLTGYTPEA